MIQGKTLLLLIIGAAALGTGVWLGQALTQRAIEPPPEIAGIYFPEPKAIDNFTLIDQTGQPFQRERFRDKWTFLYFGYTYCPDVCPLALAELNQVQQLLEKRDLDKDNAYMLISVDPERDTPERLGQYAPYFNPKFEGATGSPEELAKLAEQFGVIYRRSPGQEEQENYTVDHSSTIILIDPDAQLHAIFTPPHKPATVAADFAEIHGRYEALN